MPGDMVLGDAEGVVVIPAQVAASVAHDAFDQESLEHFVLEKVRAGASIKGVYPPDEQTMAEYEEWQRRQGGEEPSVETHGDKKRGGA